MVHSSQPCVFRRRGTILCLHRHHNMIRIYYILCHLEDVFILLVHLAKASPTFDAVNPSIARTNHLPPKSTIPIKRALVHEFHRLFSVLENRHVNVPFSNRTPPWSNLRIFGKPCPRATHDVAHSVFVCSSILARKCAKDNLQFARVVCPAIWDVLRIWESSVELCGTAT